MVTNPRTTMTPCRSCRHGVGASAVLLRCWALVAPAADLAFASPNHLNQRMLVPQCTPPPRRASYGVRGLASTASACARQSVGQAAPRRLTYAAGGRQG